MSSEGTGGAGGAAARVPAGWRPLHIAMVGQKGLPATFGGIEHHVEHVGRRLVERGHRVTVYCRRSYGEIPERKYHGMDLVPAATVGTKHLDAIVHSMTSTAKALAVRADVLHYHGIGPGLIAPVPRFLSPARVVMTVHGLDHQRAKWGAAGRMALGTAHWMSGRVPDHVVVVSRALEEHYRSEFGRTTEYVPNGVIQWPAVPASALPAAHGLVPGRYALFVGRLVPEKRPDLLIEAFRRVPGDQQLAIVGDSSFSDHYSRHLRDLAAQDPRVVFTGFAYGDELAALYQHAGVFVQPSALEGLPLTLLEAASHDAPVLVSDIPPHREVIGEGSSRHQMVPVDSVDALAGAVSLMLQHPRPRDATSRAWRQSVLDRHSWDAATDQLEALYLRAVTGRSAVATAMARGPSDDHVRRAPRAAS